MSLKRTIFFLFLGFIIFLGLYISWGIYQSQNNSVIPIKEIDNVSISTDSKLTNETEISGKVTIGNFEEVSHINVEKVDDDLYIIIHKQPSFSKENEFVFDLNNVNDISSIEKISIVSGDIYTGEGEEHGYSLGDLKSLPEQKIIWEQSTR